MFKKLLLQLCNSSVEWIVLVTIMKGGEIMKQILTAMVVMLLGVFAVTGIVSAQTATSTPTTTATPTVTTTMSPTNTPTPTGSVQGSSVTVPNAAPATGRAV